MSALLDAERTLAWLAPRRIHGVEELHVDRYVRSLRTQDGVVVAEARVDPHAPDGLARSGGAEAEAALTAVFALDADPREAEERLAWAAARHDLPLLAASLREHPLLRAPGCADPHEMLYRAIVGQQITVVSAMGQLRRLVELGDPLPAPTGEVTRAFPTDAAVAAGAGEALRGPRARIDTVVRAATALADGSLTIARDADPADLRARLVALRGIGPWTAGYVTLRLGDPDVLLTGDSAVRAGARRLGIVDLEALAADVAPWRTHLTMHCWQAIL